MSEKLETSKKRESYEELKDRVSNLEGELKKEKKAGDVFAGVVLVGFAAAMIYNTLDFLTTKKLKEELEEQKKIIQKIKEGKGVSPTVNLADKLAEMVDKKVDERMEEIKNEENKKKEKGKLREFVEGRQGKRK